ELKLRMGLHTGPVYRVADINANSNVAGGGVNMAQRVMDCGDAGHILLSGSIAELIGQLSDWAPHLEDLGEHAVKHGAKVHLYNLSAGELGNRTLPERLRAAQSATAKAGKKPAETVAKRVPIRMRWAVSLVVGLLVVVGGFLSYGIRIR